MLVREGASGQLSEVVFGRSMMRARLVYGAIAGGLLLEGAWALSTESHRAMGFVFGVLALYLLRVAVFGNRDVTADMEIALDSIERVTARAPRPPLTRGYFEVRYSKDGQTRRRFVMLPGVLSGGGEEFGKASEIFRQLGLLR